MLIYNPVAGRMRQQRPQQMEQVVAALRALGHQADAVVTTGPGTATELARQAVDAGAQAVFACGGDGTIHEVLQALVSEDSAPTVALGIIPMGSANALARHLRLPLDPMQAALQQIGSIPRLIPVGKLVFNGGVRYFTVMAGAGADGALAYELLTAQKSNLGRFAYYLHAARLFATRRFRPFEITYAEAGSGVTRSCRAVSAMAMRIGSLGGLFNRLAATDGDIEDCKLRLSIVTPPGVLSLPFWFLSGWLGVHRLNPYLRVVEVTTFSLASLLQPAPHCQADGECLGRIPVRASMVPKALLLLQATMSSGIQTAATPTSSAGGEGRTSSL